MSQVTSLQVAASLCPLVDSLHKNRECFFSLNEQQIWNLTPSTTPYTPVALSNDNAFLKIKTAVPGTYDVTALIGSTTIVATTSKTFTADTAQEFPITIPNGKLPFAVRGSLQWTLKSTNPSTPPGLTPMDVEIYILASPLPPYFDGPGVPLALLRMDPLMTAWMSSQENDWAKHAVEQLHNETRLEYDTWKGMSKYTSQPSNIDEHSSLGVEIKQLWLDLWLSDMEGLRTRADTGSKYGVNCYDTAALAQALIALGDPYTQFRMKYMTPMGYLSKTRLIGFADQDCNNPYFQCPGRPEEMMCNPTQENRSKVENHVFLAREATPLPLIYDACCGSQAGTVSLANYPGAAIDKVFPPTDTDPIGTFSSIYDGPGIRELAVSASVFTVSDQDAGWLKPGSLLRNLTDYLSGGGGVQIPYVGALPQSQSKGAEATVAAASATITFNPQNIPPTAPIKQRDLWTITLLRFNDGDETRMAYTDRKLALGDDGSELSGGNDFINDMCRGGFTMFYNATSCVLAIAESRYANSTLLGGLRKNMRDMLAAMPMPSAATKIGETQTPGQPIVVKSNFEIVVTPKISVKSPWFVGYSASTSFGNVLLKTAQVDGNGVVTFTFLARRPGTDNICIYFYDADLQIETVTSGVYISTA